MYMTGKRSHARLNKTAGLAHHLAHPFTTYSVFDLHPSAIHTVMLAIEECAAVVSITITDDSADMDILTTWHFLSLSPAGVS